MTPENAKIIWAQMRLAGDALQGQLPSSTRHPAGRNPYAHVAACVKSRFEMTYKEIPDTKVDEVVEFLEWLISNPY